MADKKKRQFEISDFLKKYCKYIMFAIIAGTAVYFSLMANNLVNNLDGVWHPSNFIAGDWEISLGRGLQRYADRARFGLVSSACNSILVFALIGLSDCLIIKRFELEKEFFSFLLVFISIANPVICESLTYSYMSVNFALALFFSVLSFFIVSGEKKDTKQKILHIAGGAICFGISMAFYQAYICVFTVLALFCLIYKFKTVSKIRDFAGSLSEYLAAFVIGGIFYFLITKLLLLRAGVKMASYKGANGIGVKSILVNLPMGFVNSYKEFWNYFFTKRLNANLEFSGIMIILVLIACAVTFVKVAIDVFRQKKGKTVPFIILFALIPTAASSICLIAVGNTVTGLMAYGILLSAIMFYCIAKDSKLTKTVSLAVLIMLSWYLVMAVENDQIALKEGITATQRITEGALDDINSMHALDNATCVAFVGRAAENEYFYKSVAYENANQYARFGGWSTEARNNRTTWTGITEVFCGTQLPFCSDDVYRELQESEKIKNMPTYPHEGYIENIDGVLVVKISDLY